MELVVLGELGERLVEMTGLMAHLGSGASLCALQAGHSADSSMGFTALEGLPMGTRPGQLDPGIILYLIMGVIACSTAVLILKLHEKKCE